jgi:hypothetical protein
MKAVARRWRCTFIGENGDIRSVSVGLSKTEQEEARRHVDPELAGAALALKRGYAVVPTNYRHINRGAVPAWELDL